MRGGGLAAGSAPTARTQALQRQARLTDVKEMFLQMRDQPSRSPVKAARTLWPITRSIEPDTKRAVERVALSSAVLAFAVQCIDAK